MSVVFKSAGGSSGGVNVGDIPASLRFAAARSTYMSRTFGAATGAGRVWTYSMFVKRGAISSSNLQMLVGSFSPRDGIGFWDYSGGGAASDKLSLYWGTFSSNVSSSALFRDPSSNYHFVIAVDTTQAAASARVKMFCNGVQLTALSATNYPSLNYQFGIGRSTNNAIGYDIGGPNYPLDGYLSRVCFVDGQALTPDSFGYFNTEINEWVSKSQAEVKAVVDAGGTNSFMLDFDDATSLTTLGYDKSSKGNNWTLNNFSLTAGPTYDHMLDVPGNSYATLNPLNRPELATTISNGNLEFNGAGQVTATQAIKGKTYIEVTNTSANAMSFGIGPVGAASRGASGTGIQDSVLYFSSGSVFKDGGAGSVATYTAYGSGVTVALTFDPDTRVVTFYRENVLQGTQTVSGTGDVSLYFVNNASATAACNFGQAPLHASATYRSASGGYFRYAPPTGFKALCQRNLPDSGTVTVSGTFTGNANADGPFVWMNGVPKTLTINNNAVTFGTHADKLANGFKLRTSSASYNTAGSNIWTATIDSNLQNIFKYNNAEGNP